ncbi:MAG: aminotransferase class IV [Anaerolineae bacterium]|nr:aminotransferase class IV [Anaerolineae bacterium]
MMPTLIKILTPDGLEPASYSADSLADATRYEPHDGVYTVANTFARTQVLKLDAHLDRMEDSAKREGIPLHLDRTRLRAALRSMILDTDFGDVRFRVTAGRDTPERLILTIEPYKPPSETIIKTGIRVITVPNSARPHPDAKTTDWLHDRGKIESSLPEGVYTALLLDGEGFILEGVSSNFYAILGGELRTAGTGVLPGIAQQIVFAVAPEILPLRKEAIHLRDLPQVSEAFITSSSRGIIPIIQIDAQVIDGGVPGPMTAALRSAYAAWTQAHLEEL